MTAEHVESEAAPDSRELLWPRLAVVVWAVLLTGIVVRVLIWPRVHSNYPTFATAALDWWNGADLYLVDPSQRQGFDNFRYSPLAAVLFLPFALLPEALGGVAWRLLNAGVFLGGLVWWSRAAAPLPLTRTQRAALCLLVVPLSVTSLNNGQSNVLVIGLLLAGLASVAEARWNRAVLCVALACFFKPYALALGLLLVLLYPGALATRLFGALAAGLALPFLLQQADYVTWQYATWFYHLGADDRRFLPLARGYQDLWMLIRTYQVPFGTTAYLLLQLAAAGLIALLCAAAQWAGWPRRRLLAVVLTFGTCWMTVLGPATEASTYALLAPALAWAVLEAWHRPRPWVVRGFVTASLVLFVLAGVAGWLPWRAEIRAWGVYPLAGLSLLAGLVGLYAQDMPRRSPPVDNPVVRPTARAA